jgi:hypothetical protein
MENDEHTLDLEGVLIVNVHLFLRTSFAIIITPLFGGVLSLSEQLYWFASPTRTKERQNEHIYGADNATC